MKPQNLNVPKVTDLKEPPVIGQPYMVPCATTKDLRLPTACTKHRNLYWPVLLPSHEDSRYTALSLYFRVHKRRLTEEELQKYGKDPHHFHIDPRFVPDSMQQMPTQRD